MKEVWNALMEGQKFGYLLYLPQQFGRRSWAGDWDANIRVQPFDPARKGDPDSLLGQSAYEQLVETAIHSIKNTELSKIVTSRKVSVEADPQRLWQWWNGWLEQFPNALVFCFHHPVWGVWMGATPELLAYSKNGYFETMALAGSKAISDQTDWTSKEREEHQVVLDMIREAIFKNGVHNIEIEKTEELLYAQVKHLRTKVTGEYNGIWSDLIQSLHPTPALSGWPVELSRAWLAQNEGYDRKLYGGVLELEFDEEKWAFVLLRCMHKNRDGVFAYVGGGVMADSNPHMEWKETMWKLKSFIFAQDENLR